MKVVIMQPALIPPASYFRLFAETDIFVFLDNVQFNRRWYTHRQPLTAHDGTKSWFTLPLKKQSRDTTMIKDLEWANNAPTKMRDEERRFAVFDTFTLCSPQAFLLNPMAFVIAQLDECIKRLDIPLPKAMLASQIPISPNLKGQDRILAICKELGATEYINSPGGKDLYKMTDFIKEGISLKFLPEVENYTSILERLAKEDPVAIRAEIYAKI